MRLLVLGGARFLGRHVVETALARGHSVTLFTRGRTPLPDAWRDRVAHRIGDRDPRVEPGLRALGDGGWDAVIDTCGYVPRVVGAGVRALAGRVGHYVFVSSMSVYVDGAPAGFDERTPVATLDDPTTEDVLPNYGALKAACEHEVETAFGEACCLVRPGLIVGPHDPTDRFGYWVARFAQPSLLGDRPARAVVPLPRERPLQFIDARDLGAWIVDVAERRIAGTFNATSGERMFTMERLVDALVDLARSARSGVEPAWIDERALIDAGVAPWTGLPLWIPQDDAQHGTLMQGNTDKARAAGLSIRPLAETLADTAAWLASRPNDGAWKNVMSAETERRLIAAESIRT